MPEHNFKVNFVVSREQAQAAHAEEARAYRERVKDADKAAKKVEELSAREAKARRKATAEVLTDEKAAARASEEIIKRANAARVKALADAGDAALTTSTPRPGPRDMPTCLTRWRGSRARPHGPGRPAGPTS